MPVKSHDITAVTLYTNPIPCNSAVPLMVPVYWAGTYRHWEPRPEEQNSWSRTKSHMDGHIADIVYGLYRLDFIRAYKDIRPNESAALHANQPMHAQAGLLRWAGGGAIVEVLVGSGFMPRRRGRRGATTNITHNTAVLVHAVGHEFCYLRPSKIYTFLAYQCIPISFSLMSVVLDHLFSSRDQAYSA